MVSTFRPDMSTNSRLSPISSSCDAAQNQQNETIRGNVETYKVGDRSVMRLVHQLAEIRVVLQTEIVQLVELRVSSLLESTLL